MRARIRTALGALLAIAGGVGCDAIDELLGRGGTKADTLRIQSISIVSDHPVDPAAPAGAAVASNGAIVELTATATFLNVDTGRTSDEDVTSAVLWKSSVPAVLQPGSDGRGAVSGGAGDSTTINAATPAVGDIAAIESNAIPLTVQ